MSRVLGLLVAAIVVVGCSDHNSASLPTTTGTATTSTSVGLAVGYMRITGGPQPPGARPRDQRLPGVVEVHQTGDLGVVTSVTVGRSGRFRIALPSGRYQLLGRPANRGLMSMTSKAFRVVIGRTVTVDLVEYAT